MLALYKYLLLYFCFLWFFKFLLEYVHLQNYQSMLHFQHSHTNGVILKKTLRCKPWPKFLIKKSCSQRKKRIPFRHHMQAHLHSVKSVQIRSFFLARIFPHLDWIRRDTLCLFIFSPNAGKYGPKKTPYLDTFHTVLSTLHHYNFCETSMP